MVLSQPLEEENDLSIHIGDGAHQFPPLFFQLAPRTPLSQVSISLVVKDT
jgi:hypothetical protein